MSELPFESRTLELTPTYPQRVLTSFSNVDDLPREWVCYSTRLLLETGENVDTRLIDPVKNCAVSPSCPIGENNTREIHGYDFDMTVEISVVRLSVFRMQGIGWPCVPRTEKLAKQMTLLRYPRSSVRLSRRTACPPPPDPFHDARQDARETRRVKDHRQDQQQSVDDQANLEQMLQRLENRNHQEGREQSSPNAASAADEGKTEGSIDVSRVLRANGRVRQLHRGNRS